MLQKRNNLLEFGFVTFVVMFLHRRPLVHYSVYEVYCSSPRLLILCSCACVKFRIVTGIKSISSVILFEGKHIESSTDMLIYNDENKTVVKPSCPNIGYSNLLYRLSKP